MYKKPLRQRSAFVYVLVALIPYSKPNLMLTYKSSRFYHELSKISGYKKSTLQHAYKHGVTNGHIDKKLPRLTKLGQRKIAPFVAKNLEKSAKLMVVFDIPESASKKRQNFRNLLKQWQFEQVQKSVWTSDKDYHLLIEEVVQELDLTGFVEVYESARLFPK